MFLFTWRERIRNQFKLLRPLLTYDVHDDKMTFRTFGGDDGAFDAGRKQFCSLSPQRYNNDTSNSPYCIVRTIFKFLIGSGLVSTSSSSITTDDTLLESSADAAFIVFSTFPWSVQTRVEKRRKTSLQKEGIWSKMTIKKSTYWIILDFSSSPTTHFDVLCLSDATRLEAEGIFNMYWKLSPAST